VVYDGREEMSSRVWSVNVGRSGRERKGWRGVNDAVVDSAHYFAPRALPLPI